MNRLHKQVLFAKQLFQSRKHQRGLAAVEFTITLPLLLFLLFVSAEMGRLLFQYNTLTKSVEDGARYLASHVGTAGTPDELVAVTDNAKNLVRYGSTIGTTPLLPGINAATVTTVTDAVGPNPIIVTVEYTYDPMIFPDTVVIPLWQGILLAIPLTARVEMPRIN